jgi:hypothetical protein
MNRIANITVEDIQHRCNATAAQMQCPLHQRNALVIVDGEDPSHLEAEVFCCCGKFSRCVCDVLRGTLGQRREDVHVVFVTD